MVTEGFELCCHCVEGGLQVLDSEVVVRLGMLQGVDGGAVCVGLQRGGGGVGRQVLEVLLKVGGGGVQRGDVPGVLVESCHQRSNNIMEFRAKRVSVRPT